MLDTPRRHGDRTAPKARPLTIDSIRRECLARIKHDRQACLWQHRGDPLLLGDAPVTLTKRARAVLDDVLERKGEKRARINLDRRHSDLQSEFEETWWTDPRRVLIREEGLDMDCDRGALVDDIPSITPEEEAALMKELEAELRAFEVNVMPNRCQTYAGIAGGSQRIRSCNLRGDLRKRSSLCGGGQQRVCIGCPTPRQNCEEQLPSGTRKIR